MFLLTPQPGSQAGWTQNRIFKKGKKEERKVQCVFVCEIAIMSEYLVFTQLQQSQLKRNTVLSCLSFSLLESDLFCSKVIHFYLTERQTDGMTERPHSNLGKPGSATMRDVQLTVLVTEGNTVRSCRQGEKCYEMSHYFLKAFLFYHVD